MNKRIENDSLGEYEVDSDANWGIFTSRVLDNYNKISGDQMPVEFIKNYLRAKKVYAIVNADSQKLDSNIANSIVDAVQHLLNLDEKDLLSNFPIDQIQSGGGTSTNMNVNEVIANTAEEMLGGNKGMYNIVNPNDHVNMSQSSNDTFPGVSKITSLIQLRSLKKELNEVINSFDKLVEDKQSKVGRSHIQDAVTMLTGEEFSAYQTSLKRDLENLNYAEKFLLEINFGGTAIGSMQNITDEIRTLLIKEFSREYKIEFKKPENYFEKNSTSSDFEKVSSSISSLATNVIKISNDLRLLSSGPRAGINEVFFPEVQAGSSIMPGKVNPSILEALNMACFKVLGNNYTIQITTLHAQLQLQAFMPIIATCLFESLNLLTNSLKMFREKCLNGMKINHEGVKKNFENSFIYATDYSEKLGYDKVAILVKKAYKENLNLRQLLEEELKKL